MEPAPLKTGLFDSLTSVIKSTPWVNWLSVLIAKPALSPPGNTTLFLRGDDTWQIPGGFVPGAHANSHAANGSDAVTLSQSQIIDLTTDLANKADQLITISGANGIVGGGTLADNRVLSPVYGNTANTICQGDDNRLVTNGNSHDHTGGAGATLNHVNFSNIGNNTHSQIDTHIANGPIHIDWTNASNNFDTSGTVQSSKFYPHTSNWRLELYADTNLAAGSGMEMYSANAGFNKGFFNFISQSGTGGGSFVFLTTPDGASFPTLMSITTDGNIGKVGIGVGSGQSSFLQIRESDVTGNIASFKINEASSLISTPQASAWEFYNDNVYYTIPSNTTRKTIAFTDTAPANHAASHANGGYDEIKPVDINAPEVTTGITSPANAPTAKGDIFVDNLNSIYYMANGSSNSSNWRKIFNGESGNTTSFSTASNGTETKLYTYTNIYTSIPRVFLTYDNTVSDIYTENFQSYSNAANMESYDWTYTQYSTDIATFLANEGAANAMYGECKVTSGSWGGCFLYTGTGASNWTDYEVSFDVESYSSGRFICCVRGDANNGAFFYQCLPNTANESKFFHCTSLDYPANNTLLDTQTAPATVTSCKIVSNSTNIKIYLNGNTTPIHDITNSNHATGSIGFSSYLGGWKMDNIVVKNIAGTNNVVYYIDSITSSNVTVGLLNNDANQSATGKLNVFVETIE